MRKRWLKWGVLFLGAWMGSGAAQVAEGWGDFPALVGSRVVVAEDTSSVLPGGEMRAPVVQQMVDGVVMTLTGRKTAREAWRSLLGPGEGVVGIKVAASGQRVSGVRLETILAVVKGLREAGFSREQIVVWDRREADLVAIGLVEGHPDYVLDWVEGGSGYDEERPISAALMGKLIWGDSKFTERGGRRFSELLGGGTQLSSESFPARVLTRRVTKVINMAALQDSYLTGVSGAMAGMVLGNLDNWRRLGGPPHFGDPYLAEIYAGEFFAGRVVLHLVDGLMLQYAGGPFPDPKFAVEHYTIYGGYDPVALDVIARDLLNERRAANRLPLLEEMSPYLYTAEILGLGMADRSKIKLEDANGAGSEVTGFETPGP